MAIIGPLSSASPAISLLSLPQELLSLIICYVDKPSAIALAGVSPHFSWIDIAQHLWSDLQLLGADSDAESEPTDTDKRCYRASADIGQGSAASVEAILPWAADKRRGVIRSIELTLRLEAVGHVMQRAIQLLRASSSTLGSLVIHHPNDHPGVIDDFETKLLQTGLSLPSLRTLTVGQLAWDRRQDDSGIALHLCDIAPRLEILTIKLLYRPYLLDPDPPYRPDYPVPRWHPSVLNLFFCFARGDGGQALYEFMELIDDFPNIRRLSMDYPLEIIEPSSPESDDRYSSGESYPVLEPTYYVERLGQLEHLEDLDWRAIDPWDFWGAYRAWGGFASLRRLVLGPVDWDDIFRVMRPMPNLEMICFTGIADRDATCFDNHVPGIPLGMHPTFASALRNSPYLEFIHVSEPNDFIYPDTGGFDFVEFADFVRGDGASTCEIYSIQHGDEEVLYFNMGLCVSPWPDVFLTDYKGKAVPMEILEEVREVEGLENHTGRWEGRGIEVGDEAWAVLTRWYEKEMETEGGE